MVLNSLKTRRIFSRTLVTLAVGALPFSVFANEITLQSDDGTLNLIGEFVDFHNDTYVIRTGLGDLRVPASKVRCDGDACQPASADAPNIHIAGSDAIGIGMMPNLIAAYAAQQNAKANGIANLTNGVMQANLVKNDGTRAAIANYHVTSTSSGDAFTTLLEGSTQFAMSSRRIRPDEISALRDSGAGDMVGSAQEHIIAVDSLVVITHPDNPVQQISLEQLRGVYSGQITNWSELGGDDAPITFVSREDGSGTRDVIEARIFGNAQPTLAEAAVIADDNASVTEIVNNDPHALGFVGYAFQHDAKPLTLINECGIAMTPDTFSARTEEYPLHRRLYLYNRDEVLDPAAQDFVNYVVSRDADEAIAASGFIDLGIGRRAQTVESDRALALLSSGETAAETSLKNQMLDQMAGFDRLSTTFRFGIESSELDERGASDMQRLADYLAAQPEGTMVRFVGFTDSTGLFDRNHTLSQSRASQVMAELQDIAGDRLDSLDIGSVGFGPVAPTACNINETGRAVNRRVEVWIEAIQA